MSKILEMRQKRGEIWDKAKAFLDEHQDANGMMSAEDTATYENMEREVVDLGHAIERQERADALEREMNNPTRNAMTSRPDKGLSGRNVRASAEYKQAFWNMVRNRRSQFSLQNAVSYTHLDVYKRQGLVWKKDRLVLTRTDWKYNHEPIIWGWRKDGKHIWYGDQKQKTVFEFDRIKNSKEDGHGHPSSKPVPLIAYLITQCTQSNGLVLDGFLGSASTLVACEQLNRSCFGIEMEPKFVDVAVKRYLQLKDGDSSDVYVIRKGERMEYAEAVAQIDTE